MTTLKCNSRIENMNEGQLGKQGGVHPA